MSRSTAIHLTAGLTLVVLVGVRVALIPAKTPDQQLFLLPWLADAETMGGGYLKQAFTNYPPFYEHVLAGLALLPGPPLLRIKLFSVLFDFALAASATRLVPPPRRLAVFLVVLALPTVIINSAMLGQSDAIYATFVILALASTVARRPVLAMLMTSVALAVKLQALMFLPFLLLMALERRQPLWTFALLPAAYVAFALPMLLAGRSVTQLVIVYLGQFEALQELSLNAPNPWAVLQKFVEYPTGLAVGLPLSVAITGAAILFLWRSGIARSREGMLVSAAILLILAPYATPKMHERFFYLVDPVLVALACTYRGYVLPMIAAQLGSAAAYVPFISRMYGRANPWFGEHGWLQRHLSIGWGAFLGLGVVSMTCALVLLIAKARELSEPRTGESAQASA